MSMPTHSTADHSLIAWALCHGGSWDAWGCGYGEFCFNGLRHHTQLDEFLVPILTAALRAEIVEARQAVPA